MPSISDILQTGLSSLLTSRDAISVAGDNIANANTPGFHRRSAELRALPGTIDRRGSFGLGVEIAEVRRVRNQYIEAQALRAVQAQGGAEASQASLAEVEALFNDLDGGGLSQALNRFFNSFGDLANNPGGTAERSSVVAAGEELGGTLGRLASELRVVRASIDDRARVIVEDVNRITARIAELNGDIRKQEIGGGEASG
ncbi:MAG: flagellar basal body protein, partial [Candidatus Methylomirabilis sp.]|nr:flagellar basal body protein [Deltaproteobacteria bacterium]